MPKSYGNIFFAFTCSCTWQTGSRDQFTSRTNATTCRDRIFFTSNKGEKYKNHSWQKENVNYHNSPQSGNNSKIVRELQFMHLTPYDGKTCISQLHFIKNVGNIYLNNVFIILISNAAGVPDEPHSILAAELLLVSAMNFCSRRTHEGRQDSCFLSQPRSRQTEEMWA